MEFFAVNFQLSFAPVIHKRYLESWLERNPQIHHSLEQLWEIREKCIEELQK